MHKKYKAHFIIACVYNKTERQNYICAVGVIPFTSFINTHIPILLCSLFPSFSHLSLPLFLSSLCLVFFPLSPHTRDFSHLCFTAKASLPVTATVLTRATKCFRQRAIAGHSWSSTGNHTDTPQNS